MNNSPYLSGTEEHPNFASEIKIIAIWNATFYYRPSCCCLRSLVRILKHKMIWAKTKALEVLTTRRAIRSYQDRVPEKELIEKILEAGTYAPTGMGRQSPIIVAVTNKEIRDRLSRLNAGVMGADSDPFYGVTDIFFMKRINYKFIVAKSCFSVKP